MTRHVLLGVMGLFIGALGIGCGAAVDAGEEGDDVDAVEVDETEQAIGGSCFHQCIAEYRGCIKSGGDREACAGERDWCAEECGDEYCELGDPSCPED